MTDDTFTVCGSHGSIIAHEDTGAVIRIDYNNESGAAEYDDILCFDVDDWHRRNPDRMMLYEEDILDIGFWTSTGKYEPPVSPR